MTEIQSPPLYQIVLCWKNLIVTLLLYLNVSLTTFQQITLTVFTQKILVLEKNEVPLLWNLAPSIFTFCKVLYFLAKITSYLLYCLYFDVT